MERLPGRNERALWIGKKAGELFEATTDNVLIIVPIIVIAEIMYIARKGRITLSFENTLQMIEENDRGL